MARVESIEQIPAAYIGDGDIKLAYTKGKKPSHKGETNLVSCTSQNISLSETLKWDTKILKDEKTGAFESKVIAFKLKHVSSDGHKEKTLGTADIDLASLATSPKSEKRLAIQFAARHQGKLKTKATLMIACQWLKVGDKPYHHEDHPNPQQSLDEAKEEPEDQFFSAHTLMTTPFFGADETASEMSTTSSNEIDDLDDSTAIIESADLDSNDFVSRQISQGQTNTSLSRLTNPVVASSTSSSNLALNIPHSSSLSSIPENSSTNDIDASTATASSSSAPKKSASKARPNQANGTPSEPPSPQLSVTRVSGSATSIEPVTKTIHMRKQASHSDLPSNRSLQSTKAASLSAESASSASQDPRIYSASMSVLPEFQVDSSHNSGSASQLVQGPVPTSRSRGRSMAAGSAIPPKGTRPHSVTFSTPPPGSPYVQSPTPPVPSGGSNTSLNVGAGSSASFSSFSIDRLSAGSIGASSHSGPQASIRPPIEASPYFSYVDNDAPALPDSAQSSLVFLAPNSFAIQNAAISGDEVARLRAECMDKNFKLGLLAKQVGALEKKLSGVTQKWEEAERANNAKNAEISTLERKLRRLRKKQKLLDSTMDESSTTSSGNDPAKATGGEKKKRKRKAKESASQLNLTRTTPPRPFWTPEDERLGLLITLAISLLVLLFLSSPQFRFFTTSALETVGLLSPTPVIASGDLFLADQVHTAANELSEAFASALNFTQVANPAPPIPT